MSTSGGTGGVFALIGGLNGFAPGLFALAICALMSAVISLFWLRIPRAIVAGEELAAAAE